MTSCIRQWCIHLTLGGGCRWQGGGRVLWQKAGDLLITRPGAVVAWQVPRDEPEWHVAYAVASPSPRCENWLNAHLYEEGMATVHLENEILVQVRRGMHGVCRTYRRRVVHRDEWALLALERVVLTLRGHLSNAKMAFDPRVADAIAFIHENMARRLTCAEIARAVHLSVSHLSFLFTRHIDEAPMQFLERLRCERAAEMLRFGSYSIREIAAATGFGDAAYFCNRFRRYSGMAPSAYRNRWNAQAMPMQNI